MKIGYFPGCSLHGSSVEYEDSLRAVAKVFNVELCEIRDWNCCGATAAHNLNKLLSLSLPARILALAEEQGYSDMLVPCAACYNRLLAARHEILHDEKLRLKIPQIIEMEVSFKTKPMNIIDFIEKYIQPELKNKVVQPFQRKTACYYGCLLVRPEKLVNFERMEDPLRMENIMKVIGAKPIDWAFKTECCGAGLSVTRTDIVSKLSSKIVDDAMTRGADSIIVACPMCQSNLDMRRPGIDEVLKKTSGLPVLFITEAIGLSLGLSEMELGLKRHFVEYRNIIESPAVEPKKPVKQDKIGEAV